RARPVKECWRKAWPSWSVNGRQRQGNPARFLREIVANYSVRVRSTKTRGASHSWSLKPSQPPTAKDLLAATLPFLYKRRPPRSVVFSTGDHTTVIDRPGTMFDGEARSKRQLRWSFWRMDASARSVREKMRASQ
ncbi:hypothetical protein CPAR01_04147, partial [Colletotrichum paranaense]